MKILRMPSVRSWRIAHAGYWALTLFCALVVPGTLFALQPASDHSDTSDSSAFVAIGTVIVQGEQPTPFTFTIPRDVSHKFNFDLARIRVWDSVTKDNAISLNDAFIVDQTDPLCNFNHRAVTDFQGCFSGNGINAPSGCSNLTVDDGDVDLIDYVAYHTKLTSPTCTRTVYVEGLMASSTLGDSSIDLLVDDGSGGGIYVTQDSKTITVASITVTPTLVTLGTEMTITLQPAIAPLAFDSATTAAWDGVYQPLIGLPSGAISLNYSASQFHESSTSEAIVLGGDGTLSGAEAIFQLESGGMAQGMLSLGVGGIDLQLSLDLVLGNSDAVTIEGVEDPDRWFGPNKPYITGEPDSFSMLIVANTSNPSNVTESFLLDLTGHHIAVVVRVDSTAETSATYRSTIALPGLFDRPGSSPGAWMADNIIPIVTSNPYQCRMAGYEIALFGGNGSDYDAYVELFDINALFSGTTGLCFNQSPKGTGIPGTAKSFSSLPGNEVSYLSVRLDVTITDDFWLYLEVSSDDAGWIIAPTPSIHGAAQVSTLDCVGLNSPLLTCGACYTFIDHDPLASYWTEVFCHDDPDALGADAPTMLLVDLISLDTSGVEIDRISQLVLSKVLGDDGDPLHTVYHNSLNRPIVLVDTALNTAQYSRVIPILVVEDGNLVVVPNTQ